MQKYCFCGEPIPNNWRLCELHATEYGTDPELWEDWLRFLVSDRQREWNAYQRSKEIDLCDIEVLQRDPRITLLEKFDGDGFIILRGCEDCEG